jgi:hypothetical protein
MDKFAHHLATGICDLAISIGEITIITVPAGPGGRD